MKQIILVIAVLLVCVNNAVSQGITSDDTLTMHTLHATYYSNKFEGRKTSSGEVFRQSKYTAAHSSLKCGTLLLVTNLSTNQQVIVKVNDRCPRAGILDLSSKAAKQIGIGSRPVQVQVLPQRFYYHWEHQSDYLSILQNGTFLQMADLPYIPPMDEAIDPHSLSKAHPEPVKAPETTSTPVAPKELQEALYELELCTISQQSESNVVIERVPIHYRNHVKVVPSGEELHIRLCLSMKADEIKEVQKDLYDQFPRSKAVEAQ